MSAVDVSWNAEEGGFTPPVSGAAGPVKEDPVHPAIGNDEFRLAGRQPTFATQSYGGITSSTCAIEVPEHATNTLRL
jgi:hypothetical protein